jgi:hypothetical protein
MDVPLPFDEQFDTAQFQRHCGHDALQRNLAAVGRRERSGGIGPLSRALAGGVLDCNGPRCPATAWRDPFFHEVARTAAIRAAAMRTGMFDRGCQVTWPTSSA